MSAERRWGLFSYLTVDHLAAQAYLDRMALQGWALKRVWLGLFARFQRTERTDLTYAIDWISFREGQAETSCCLRLYQDAGWELVQSVRCLNIYASAPGAHPDPLYTNGELEYRRFQTKVLRDMALPLLLLLLQILLQGPFFTGMHPFINKAATLNLIALAYISFPLLTAGALTYTGYLACRMLRWRRAAAEGLPLPAPGPRVARLCALLVLPCWLWFLLFLLSFLLDMALSLPGWLAPALLAVLGGSFALAAILQKGPCQRRSMRFLSAMCLLSLLLSGAMRLWFIQPIHRLMVPYPPIPMEENARADVLDEDHTFLLSRRWYFEWGEEDDPDHRMEIEAFRCRASAAADGAVRALWEDGMEPVEGCEGVWRRIISRPAAGSDAQVLLLRRDNDVVSLRLNTARAPDDLLPRALAWIKTWGGDRFDPLLSLFDP